MFSRFSVEMMSESLTHQYIPKCFQPTPEFRFVTAHSWNPSTATFERQKHIINLFPQSGLNWKNITFLVQRHDIVGQFCAMMAKLEWLNVPTDAALRLKQIRTEQTSRALGQVAELSRVGARFSEAGIDIIPLKGVALSQELYGNPYVRNSCDLDILVKSEDVRDSGDLLTQLGYRHACGYNNILERHQRHMIETIHHHEYLNDNSGTHLELHWRSCHWTNEQTAALWASSLPLTWLDCGLKQLSPETNILFLMDHGARHDWPCLKWLSDVAMLADKLSEDGWNSLLKRAACFDLERVFCQTATLLNWFYGIEVPPSIKDMAKSKTVVRKMSAQAAKRLLALNNVPTLAEKRFPGISSALQVKRLRPATPMKSLLKGILITHDDFNKHPLPDRFFWLYAFMRPYYWFRRRCMKR